MEGGTVLVNGVNVVPYVDSELNRRFPGRQGKDATTVAGLRASWEAVHHAWSLTINHVLTLPAGSIDRRVVDEWSTAETLRHLVLATDVWLRKTILGLDNPFHPIGLANPEADTYGFDTSLLTHVDPTWAQIVHARTDRTDQLRELLTGLSDAQLDEQRPHPWAPQYHETIRSCLQTILAEEWDHLRYIRRDLAFPDPR